MSKQSRIKKIKEFGHPMILVTLACSMLFISASQSQEKGQAIIKCKGKNPIIAETSIVPTTKGYKLLLRKKIGAVRSFNLYKFSGLVPGEPENIVFAKDVTRASSGTIVNGGIFSIASSHKTAFISVDRTVFELVCNAVTATDGKAQNPPAVAETPQTSEDPLTPPKAELLPVLSAKEVAFCTANMKIGEFEELQQCQKLRLQMPSDEKCAGPSGMAAIEKMIANCYDVVLDSEFKKRSIVVKINDESQYRAELQQQESFKRMRADICGRYDKCNGSWALSAKYNCQLQLTGYRHQQIRGVNQMGLAVKDKKYEGKSWGESANIYARLLCKMPAPVWGDDRAPADCQSRVFGEIASFNGVPLPGVDPCGNSED